MDVSGLEAFVCLMLMLFCSAVFYSYNKDRLYQAWDKIDKLEEQNQALLREIYDLKFKKLESKKDE